MCGIFLAQAPARIAAARAAAASGEAPALRSAAHALRSSCGQLGATEMQTLCERIEMHAGRGEMTLASVLAGRLESELARYRAWLAATLKEMKVTG